MRIFLAGSKEFGFKVFNMLEERGYEVVGISAPAGDRLRMAGGVMGIPHYDRAFPYAIEVTGADLIVAAHCHQIIDPLTRGCARYGAIGYHPSLLPAYKGKHAIQAQIRDGVKKSGGTVYELTDEIDGGPILAQDNCLVGKNDDARTLWRRDLMPIGINLLRDVVDEIAARKAMEEMVA